MEQLALFPSEEDFLKDSSSPTLPLSYFQILCIDGDPERLSPVGLPETVVSGATYMGEWAGKAQLRVMQLHKGQWYLVSSKAPPQGKLGFTPDDIEKGYAPFSGCWRKSRFVKVNADGSKSTL